MAKIQYVFDTRFSAKTLDIIEAANNIIDEYQAQGFDLTLRQLYYQFVARDYIPNKQTEYKRLGNILNDARLAGLVDWEAIVDRTRNLRELSTWDDPKQILWGAANSYRTDKWANQPYRVEAWIEKDALIGVIEGVCNRHQIPYFSCRGYVSQSEVWAAAERIREAYEEREQQTLILHLGDHDPSGIDMTRDITDRLHLFLGKTFDWPPSIFEVERLALNTDQIQKYNPPPNPAKSTDSRYSSYIASHGNKSWELDALDPRNLAALIDDAVIQVRDTEIWDEECDKERSDKMTLNDIAVRYRDIKDFLGIE